MPLNLLLYMALHTITQLNYSVNKRPYNTLIMYLISVPLYIVTTRDTKLYFLT